MNDVTSYLTTFFCCSFIGFLVFVVYATCILAGWSDDGQAAINEQP